MTPRPLTVVNVSYPFAPVDADPVGGAEQVLARIDRALVANGHRSIVVAPESSVPAGELRAIPAVPGPVTDAARRAVHAAARARIAEAIARDRPDVLHFHGLDFDALLPDSGPPAMATLHLPLDWYAPGALAPQRRDVFLHPVSPNQARRAPAGAVLAGPIENGVPLPDRARRKRRFAFTLGRICPEKGMDDAIDAARGADMPLLLAGAVFPYPEHQRFFRSRVLPRLDRARRWIGAVAGARKQRLLARARCLLVPSKAAETSSLVAMEALAAGTPAIAYRAGALSDIIADGRTGFLVDSVEEMSAAMREAERIDPETCRAEARARFSAERMTNAYLARYAELAGR